MLVCLATRTATASASVCGLGTSVPSEIFYVRAQSGLLISNLGISDYLL